MRDTPSIRDLRNANPSTSAPEPPEALFDTIIRASFDEDTDAPIRPEQKVIRRLAQAFLGTMVVLLIGVGVAWAATGSNPVTSLFGDDVEIVDSDYGLSSLSILEPATQERFDELPDDVAFRASAKANTKTIMANMRDGFEPFHERGPSRTKGFDPIPIGISAVGSGTVFGGTAVRMMVIEGELCAYLSLRGPSMCGTVSDVHDGLVYGSGEQRNDRISRIYGVVPDDVATIRIEGGDPLQVPVYNNAFDIRNVTPGDLELIALDQDKNELFRCTGGRLTKSQGFGGRLNCS